MAAACKKAFDMHEQSLATKSLTQVKWRITPLYPKASSPMRSPITSPSIRPKRKSVSTTAPLHETSQPLVSVASTGRWLGLGKEVAVQGFRISGGLMYVGSNLKTALGTTDPCLVDPTLPVAPRSTSAKLTGYWPSYAALSPQERRAYLEWLANGRSDPLIDIGYVFLYFYGIERRAILDAALDSSIMREYPVLASELTRLLSIYGDKSKSFKKYASQLLDWVGFTNGPKMYADPNLTKGPLSLLKIKFAMGQAAADAVPLPAKLMLAWVKNEPAFSLRTPVSRCPAQFDTVFETLYQETFGAGATIAPGPARLKFAYTAASSAFSNMASFAMSFKDIPDISLTPKLATMVQALIDKATTVVEPFSRFVARNPQATEDVEGLLLLPMYLWPTSMRQALQHFKRSVLKAPTALTGKQLVQTLGATNALSKDKSSALAQALATMNIGMEPDMQTSPRALRDDECIVLFDLSTTPEPSRDDTNYNACLLTVQLACAVASADGNSEAQEFKHLHRQVQHWNHLALDHRRRLGAHLHIRRKQPVKLGTLSKQLPPLSQETRESVVQFMAALVQVDSAMAWREVKMMEKVYRALGLDPTAFLLEHKDVTKPTTKKVLAPVKKTLALDMARIEALQKETAVISGILQGIVDTDEPARPPQQLNLLPAPKVQLDLARIAALQQDTAQVDALLHGIFHESTEVSAVPEPASPVSPALDVESTPNSPNALFSGLDDAHNALTRALLANDSWARTDLQAIADSLGLMLDGALESINDAAYDAFDGPLTEGDDPIDIHPDTKKRLPL